MSARADELAQTPAFLRVNARNRNFSIGAAAVVLSVLATTAVAAQDLGSSWAIRGATLINGKDTQAINDAVVSGTADRITCAGRAADCVIPVGAKVIDAAGKWLIPGLIDSHVHVNRTDPLAGTKSQLIRFAYGITTTRDAGSVSGLEASLNHRSAASDRLRPEPRLVVSAVLDEELLKLLGARDYEELTRLLVAKGADAIKILRPFSVEEWQGIVRQAHAGNIPVWGHTWTFTESHLDRAVEAGADGVTHMPTFSAIGTSPVREDEAPRDSAEYWLRTRERWLSVDEAGLVTAARRMAAKNVWFEATLLTERYFTLTYPVPDEPALYGRVPSLWDHLRPVIPAGGGSYWALRDRAARMDVAYQRMCSFIGRIADLPVRLIAGTDTLAAGVSLADEIGALRDCGLSPMAAIESATREAALALRRPDIGVIEPGRLADLVVLDGDPLKDAQNLGLVDRVIKGGVMYDPDVLLADLRAAGERTRSAGNQRVVLQAAGAIGMFAVVAGVIWRVRRRRP